MKKKILILGGANVHVKMVEAAHEMGLFVIVTDYLDKKDSPAKQIADKYYDIDITNIDAIVEMCKFEKIDAVLSSHLDPGQRPYYQICHRLGLPCYIDSWEQVFALTDKDKFKEVCLKNNIDIIPTFSENEKIDFPVLVKPAHSRGSRGQTICNNAEDLKEAIKRAKKESDNNQAIIEKYMGNCNDFTMTYFFVDGEAYLMRTADRLLGEIDTHLEKVAMAEITPSKYNEMYYKNINSKMIKMLKSLKIKNGPVFMQGFVDGDTVRFYDPGFRFPGTEFDSVFIKNMKLDLNKKLIYFALNGHFTDDYGRIDHKMHLFNNQIGMELWPCVGPGTINHIMGFDEVSKLPDVICYTMRHSEGETIGEFYNVNQRLAEIDILCENIQSLKKTIKKIHQIIKCEDSEGKDLIINRLSVEKF